MSAGVVLLVLLAAVMHASWNAALRSGSDRMWSGMAICFSAAPICLAIVPFLSLPGSGSWPFIFLSAAIHIVYQFLLIRMYRDGEFGVTYPVARGSSPLLIAAGGALFSAEYLAPVQFLGVALVCVGIFSLAIGGHHLHRRSVLDALATGASIAAYSLTDGTGARLSGNAASYTTWMMLLTGLSMPVMYMWIHRRDGSARMIRGRSRFEMAIAFGGGAISVAGYGIVIWAWQRSPMGIVSALRETSVLFASFLGWAILKEPFTPRKILSALLICAGVLCLR